MGGGRSSDAERGGEERRRASERESGTYVGSVARSASRAHVRSYASLTSHNSRLSDFGGKVLPLFFPPSLAAAARLLLACLASLAAAAALVLSPPAPAHALALASRTWPDIPPLAPIVCISHSSNPPLLVPLVRCCELVVAASSLSLSRWFGSITHLRYAIGTLLVGRSARGISLISCLHASLLATRRDPLIAFVRHGKLRKPQEQSCAWCVTLLDLLVTRAVLLGLCNAL